MFVDAAQARGLWHIVGVCQPKLATLSTALLRSVSVRARHDAKLGGAAIGLGRCVEACRSFREAGALPKFSKRWLHQGCLHELHLMENPKAHQWTVPAGKLTRKLDTHRSERSKLIASNFTACRKRCDFCSIGYFCVCGYRACWVSILCTGPDENEHPSSVRAPRPRAVETGHG